MQTTHDTMFKALHSKDRPLSLYDFKELINDEIALNNHFIDVLTDGFSKARRVEYIRETSKNISIYRQRIDGLKSLRNRIEDAIDRSNAIETNADAEKSTEVCPPPLQKIPAGPLFPSKACVKSEEISGTAPENGGEKLDQGKKRRGKLHAMAGNLM